MLPPEIGGGSLREDMLEEAEDVNKELIREGWRHVLVSFRARGVSDEDFIT